MPPLLRRGKMQWPIGRVVTRGRYGDAPAVPAGAGCDVGLASCSTTATAGLAHDQPHKQAEPRKGAGLHMLYRTWRGAAIMLAALALTTALPGLAAPKAPAPSAPLPLHDYRPADMEIEGFPVWLGDSKKLDRMVVLVEGFDLFNQIGPPELMRMVSPVADRLAGAGFSALVVDFPDSHLPPDETAPYLERAIRAAARASGGPVAVAGLSAGGITARWALVAAEERGEPLPVHTLFLLDTPNRGAHFCPELQAMVLRYGAGKDREALTCPAAHALITSMVKHVSWKRIGLPGAWRKVPAKTESDSTDHEAFYKRLRALNDNRGYPKKCRIVAVAQGCREPQPTTKPFSIYRLWLPGGYGWTYRGEAEDQAPGSLLPEKIAVRLRVKYPLGIAGTRFRHTPIFVTTESALDAAAGETPRFDAWYARKAGLPQIAHDDVDHGALDFIVEVMSRTQASGNTASLAPARP